MIGRLTMTQPETMIIVSIVGLFMIMIEVEHAA